MTKLLELAKNNLSAIAGVFVDSNANEELIALATSDLFRIANNKHDVAACLAQYFLDDAPACSVHYITTDDVYRPLPDGKIIKVTVEYCPAGEAESQ